MKRAVGLICALLIVSISAAGHSRADTSFRCGNQLIEIGDTMHKVKSACGKPLAEQRIGERTTYRILPDQQLKVKDSLYLFEWLYRRGTVTYVLIFEGSRLSEKSYYK